MTDAQRWIPFALAAGLVSAAGAGVGAGVEAAPPPRVGKARARLETSDRALRLQTDAERAAVGGKYAGLLRTLPAPEDRALYGDFNDWGHWTGTAYRGATDLPAGYWVYVAPNWFIWESRRDPPPAAEPPAPWGPEQATGPPDTFEAGDLPTAWASATPDEQSEWLDLRYAAPVLPGAVLVHASFNPGALVRVSVFAADGREVTVWSGKDPTEPGSGRGVSVVPFRSEFPTQRVRLYLNSKDVAGWNEIDAVGLVDEFGRTQWAESAQASSTYATLFKSVGAERVLR